MELRDLEYFVAVAEERSFTRGALRVAIVQSAASAAIRRLEHELGQRVLDRGSRSVELTEAGRLVLGRARTLIAEAHAVHDDLDALAGGLRGTVSLATVLSTGGLDLVSVLTRFHRLHPGVAVRLRLCAGPEQQHLSRLLDGEFDLALVPLSDQPPPSVTAFVVGRIRLVLACRTDDPLARARGVRYRDVAARDFVDFPLAWGNRSMVDGLFHADGATRDVAFEVVDVHTALVFVREGLGIGFVPQEAVDTDPGLAVVDLREPPPPRRLGLAVPADRPVAAATSALFRAIVRATASR